MARPRTDRPRLFAAALLGLAAGATFALADDSTPARVRDATSTSVGLSRWKWSHAAGLDGLYPEAQGRLRDAVAQAEKLGPDSPELAESIEILAAVYVAQEKYAEAEPVLGRLLSLEEKALGAEDVGIAPHLKALAACKGNLNKFAEADSLLKRALAIEEMALGADDPEVVSTLTCLATLHFRWAVVTMCESFAATTRVGDRPTIEAVNALAEESERSKAVAEAHFGEAGSLFERALKIQEKLSGPDHPEVIEILDALTTLRGFQHRPDKAETLLGRRLAIAEKVHGPEHREVVQTLTLLGDNSRERGHYREAEAFLRRALTILETGRLRDEPDSREMRDSIADSLRKATAAAEVMADPALRPTDDDLKFLKGPGIVCAARDVPGLLNCTTVFIIDLEKPIDDAGMIHLRGLVGLDALRISGGTIGQTITDAGLVHLARLTSLKILEIPQAKITGRGLAYLKGLTALLSLDLTGSTIGDGDLAPLQDLKSLEYLCLTGTKVTDAGVAHLKKLTGLKSLNLQATRVSEAAERELEEAVPGQEISR